jgi:hypothetical protein
VLKKSFSGDERNFLGPLMRFASGDVRDHIVSHTPLVVDELIVACDCDRGAGHTFSGHLAGEEIVQPGQNPLPTSFGFASGNGAAFATSRTIPATTTTVLTVPLKGGSISPIIVATGVCAGCMLKSRLKELQCKGLAGAFV